ncbi:MAG: Ig domain-containing protein [Terriglobia bacterium]
MRGRAAPARGSLLRALVAGGLLLGSAAALSPAREAGPRERQEEELLRIPTSELPDGIVGKAYRKRLQARGGRKPYTWRVISPRLAEGLTLNPSTGAVTGTPTSIDFYDFTVRVTDSSSPPQTTTRYFALAVAEPLILETRTLPGGIVRAPYRARLWAQGGTPPLRWEISAGALPPGLALNRATGLLSGTPTRAGEFRFTVRVSDAGRPQQEQERTFRGQVVAPLAVKWLRLPRVEEGGIYGSVEVSNGSRDNFDLTVIVLAVNDYGKAFALGYHHFVLEQGTVSRALLFGFSLPQGDYVVHVDAVAEVAPKNAIYRARREQGPLRIE